MADDTVLLRCNHCNAVNKVPVEKIENSPKCGKCKEALEILQRPIDVKAANFDHEVMEWPGLVLLEFWTPW
ncbi:MAG: hypothetical protein AB1638_02885 [Nitrospirota bacterium]